MARSQNGRRRLSGRAENTNNDTRKLLAGKWNSVNRALTWAMGEHGNAQPNKIRPSTHRRGYLRIRETIMRRARRHTSKPHRQDAGHRERTKEGHGHTRRIRRLGGFELFHGRIGGNRRPSAQVCRTNKNAIQGPGAVWGGVGARRRP